MEKKSLRIGPHYVCRMSLFTCSSVACLLVVLFSYLEEKTQWNLLARFFVNFFDEFAVKCLYLFVYLLLLFFMSNEASMDNKMSG